MRGPVHLSLIGAVALLAVLGSGGTPAVAAPAPGDSKLFDTWTGYQSGRFPQAVAAADLSGDGWPDVAWARQDFFQNGLNVQLNLGDGTLAAPTIYPAQAQSNDVEAGDLDGDADLDLVVASQGNNLANGVVDIYLNSGAGALNRTTTTGGTAPVAAALADLDGDADLDIALANYWGGSTVSVLRNRGNATFDPEVRYPAGSQPTDLTATDLDGDGDRDLAVARMNSQTGKAELRVLTNNGAGSFATAKTAALNLIADDPALASADLEQDGDADLAISGRTKILLLDNLGGLNFSSRVAASGFAALSLRASDIDSDGDSDILGPSFNSNTGELQLLKNDGSGGFGAPIEIESGRRPTDLGVADFDRNGRLDLAVANRETDTGAIHPQRSDGSFAAPPFTFNGFTLPLAVATADFDRDGDLDVAEAGEDIHLMLNEGDGTFLFGDTVPSGNGLVHAVVASDLNGDGASDLLWAPDDPPYPYAYALNNGDGTFGPRVERQIQTCGTGDPATADVDDDGDQDVLIPNNRSGPSLFCEAVQRTVRVAINDGSANFSSDYGVEVFPGPQVAAGADLDGDGKTDLIAASAVLSVAKGTGQGQFAPYTTYSARGSEIVARDIDADGDRDVVTADGSTATAYTLRNNGSGALTQIVPYPGESVSGYANGTALDLGDVDADGLLDLVVANPSANDAGVYFGTAPGSFRDDQVRYGAHGCFLDVSVADMNADSRPEVVGPACLDGPTLTVPGGVTVLFNQSAPAAGDAGGAAAGDTTTPDTRIGKGPKKRTTSRKAKFRFSSTEDGSSFRCKLDRKPFKPCTSPKTYRRLKLGKHKFKVQATDAAGNVDPTPAVRKWKVLAS